MKTNRLILKNGLLTLLLILSLSLNCFSSVSANESVASAFEIKHRKANDLAVLAASKEDLFTETLKNWMEDGLYWESASANEAESSEISGNILQPKAQNETLGSSDVIDQLTESLKIWMQNGFYWDKIDKQ